MGSKIQKLRKEAEALGIDLDANETISDLEAKIAVAQSAQGGLNEVPKVEDGSELPRKGEVVIPRRQPVKRINFTTRLEREAKKDG
ncbi:hypothetical protein KAR91_52715 [Candidatus Pacearchaeota archaeon]|nr:hypothetical protein [Candidatus Pacearchaeota archaeon]